MISPNNRRTGMIFFATLTALIAGCDKNEEIRTYSAPRETPGQVSLTSTAPQAPSDPAANVQWTLPAGWKVVPEQKPMRVATLEVGQGKDRLEIALTSFPGDVGGLTNNVNRWRSQIGLEPVDEKQAATQIKPLAESGPNAKRLVVDITGTSAGAGNASAPARLIGVIIDDGAGSTWFVKAVGAPEILTAQLDSILEFAKSIRFTPADPNAPKVAQQELPAGHPAMPADAMPPALLTPNNAAPSAAAAGTSQMWTAPKSWTAQEAQSPLVAVYTVPDAAGAAAAGAKVTVSFLAGDGGGALANINRWRGQIGLTPVEKLDQQPTVLVEVSGRQGVLLDLKNDTTAKGMLVAMIVDGGRTWFFKMTGPASLLAERKQEFVTFVSSTRLPASSESKL